MNNKKQPTNQSENTLTEIFKYEVKEGVSEFHVMIHSIRPEDTYEEQLNAVANAYNDLLAGELKGAMAVFKRYFLSDTANQADLLLAITTESSDCALSVVEQPPLDGTKIALWAYLQTKRLCQNAGTPSFYAQSPDFLKPGLCYYPKFL